MERGEGECSGFLKGVLVKTCPENMQQMYKILTTGKYDFNKVARQYLKIF